ncbi:MAG: T9SS type A sorting domain-containing protein [Saprospiraceae bacterium]|nr:T9SS type A sorting domain-containing protein [Saprospiraceae bacterium]
MKTIMCTLLSFFVLTSIAQPTINSSAIVGLGESEPTQFINLSNTNWNSGTHGPNQIWNFSMFMGGQECDYSGLASVDSPYFDSFPDSDVYFICSFEDSQGFTSKNHTFYQIDGDNFRLAGAVSLSIDNPSFDSVYIVYTDLLDWGTFPYSYEDLTEDSFEARVTTYAGNQIISAIQSGMSSHEVDSYGTLTTPAGTFKNTLRVKRIEMAENAIPGIPFTSPQESYRYTWYAEDEKGVILNLDSIVIKDFNNNIISTEYSGSYRIEGPTTTSTSEKVINELLVSPNPGFDQIKIDHQGISNYDIYIYSLDGKRQEYSIKSESQNSKTILLDRSQTLSGLYFIRMNNTSNGKVSTTSILLQ